MSVGKSLRMNSIFRKDTGKSVVVAIDHGSIAGPMDGINEPGKLIDDCVRGGADAVLTTRGFVKASEGAFDRNLGLILRMTGGFTVLGGGFEEELITSTEMALRYGAVGGAVTVKFGHPREGFFTRQASLVADSCEDWGLPLMIEAMAKGKDMKSNDPAGIKLASRAAAEIGADIVKTYYTGDPDSFAEVVEGCMVPIVILGGAKTNSIEDVFSDVYYSIQAGGSGIAIGRNIWQHKDTKAMIEAMSGLVHEGWTVKQAMAYI
ncbi:MULTISPECIES: class I fructose-bisphosphate aldolase [unclassified Oceanispirochaeta]|uniref:class I fructose-bisphosphate aldolase n=1 Tax=unclassified Oceanispirochaeta TaxID=2635722 RepID=UPI000E095A2D|nr:MULTISPECIES: 2-amino-3,7-dideoxy-D-threo-hept-6-ulosonate synthase [unclassified Oceanispirochaeta]MBF9018125.1 fructose-bisphosphate aldolase [Oceanispirochaeta sp. M2]NPD74589.1 fructose-bisphosphate aldolase [Oceanispirochaeta sp. M1]RDG29541.1 fructose-bisphosphate aldolase [Oceanispirochaeta sp. M1]